MPCSASPILSPTIQGEQRRFQEGTSGYMRTMFEPDPLRNRCELGRGWIDNGRRTSTGLAEGAGFEPAIRFPVYTLSRRAPSTARPPLQSALQSRRAQARRLAPGAPPAQARPTERGPVVAGLWLAPLIVRFVLSRALSSLSGIGWTSLRSAQRRGCAHEAPGALKRPPVERKRVQVSGVTRVSVACSCREFLS
jgi:hypothetical protein